MLKYYQKVHPKNPEKLFVRESFEMRILIAATDSLS